jgi:ubiquinone/menaquinone biosynthesis C-methylase UbiE
MKKNIIKDFSFSNDSKDIIKLNFLKKVSKTSVCVSKKTGLVYYDKFKKSSEVLNEWSKKIYNGKMNQNSNNYTDDVPAMSARHFYVLDFLKRFIKIEDKKLIDFACGEGGLLIKARKFFNVSNLNGVEHSKRNISYIKKRFKKEKIKLPNLYQSNIENFSLNIKADLGTLTWTLCNCSEPLKILGSISNNLKKDGYLIVAESSRILVPFRKSIYNYFNSKADIGHTHPWHWSFNSLSNIFKVCGFELVKNNRYWDENDLVLIFKNTKKFNQKYKVDNYLEVIDYLKRWNKESRNYNLPK